MIPMNVAHVLRATLTNAAHFAAQNHLRGTSETTRLRPICDATLSPVHSPGHAGQGLIGR